MTRPALLLALLLYLPAARSAHPQNSSAPHDQAAIREVVDLERQSKEAAIRRDVSFVERVLADDYVGISPLGAVITKADTVAARKAAQLQYDSIDISEMVVRVYGNTAVVTARAEVKGTDLGEDFSGPYRFTRVWVKRNGRWRTVSYQATVTR
ncbi:MAG TPA: nuclear transport factor 2 family protein [Terriglobales bacterium]|nr:nuclear transport factor 2 family protein [Terriglobales bacterium]